MNNVAKTFVAFALLHSTLAAAAADEAVVRAMVRRTNVSPEDIRKNYDACDSGITRSMSICSSYLWTQEDLRLEQVFERSLAEAKEMNLEASLTSAQQAWIAYRDAACGYEAEIGAGGGTLEGLLVLSCKRDLTKERADRLKTNLDK